MHLPNMNDAKIRSKSEVKHIELDNNLTNSFLGKKYFLRTYGCQMNEHDSEQIACILENMGFARTDTIDNSDIIVLNTCAIRENAHDKVFGFLGRCKHLKDTKKDLIIGVCGCMAQEESVIEEIMKKHSYIDLVFGTHNIHELTNLIIEKDKKQNIEVYSIEGNVYENINYKRDSKYTAWVNIMYGCDKFCTYCIVPYTRGKQRSRKLDKIVEEVKILKEKGYQEVTLLGQNVNAYGKDLEKPETFSKLLESVANTGINRIRFVTSHPWDFTDEMINTISQYKKIMPYIHLPLQSGSDKILKLMGRRYTKEEYITLFNKIKDTIPSVAITTDIIVGFPNETDEDFKDTLDVVNTCKFDGAFTFIYSPREGTPASKMIDKIDLATKEKRLQELNMIVNNHSLYNNQKYLNKIVKVLILGISEKDNDKVYGYTETMKLVNVSNAKDKIGEIIDVTIIETKSFSLDGIYKN